MMSILAQEIPTDTSEQFPWGWAVAIAAAAILVGFLLLRTTRPATPPPEPAAPTSGP